MIEYDNDELDLMLKDLENELKEVDIPKVESLNVPVYWNMLKATAILELFVSGTPNCEKVAVKIKQEQRLGEISLVLPSLGILPIRLIQEIKKDADKFETQRINGGKQRLCVTFRRLFC